jgi:hypothetical protein
VDPFVKLVGVTLTRVPGVHMPPYDQLFSLS